MKAIFELAQAFPRLPAAACMALLSPTGNSGGEAVLLIKSLSVSKNKWKPCGLTFRNGRYLEMNCCQHICQIKSKQLSSVSQNGAALAKSCKLNSASSINCINLPTSSVYVQIVQEISTKQAKIRIAVFQPAVQCRRTQQQECKQGMCVYIVVFQHQRTSWSH